MAHNPGAIPSDYRLFAGADLIIVFENDYGNFTANGMDQKLSDLAVQSPNGYRQQNFAYMIHGVPASWSDGDFRGFLDDIKGGAQMILASDRSASNGTDIYDGFGADWMTFVDSLATLN